MGLADRLPPPGFVLFELTLDNASPGRLFGIADRGLCCPLGVADPGAGMRVTPDPDPGRIRGVPGVPGGLIPGVDGTKRLGVPGTPGRDGMNGFRDIERLNGGRGGAMA